MPSLRSKLIKVKLNHSKLLKGTINDQNLVSKRQKFNKLDKFFPVSKSVKITPFENNDFKGDWITVPASRPNKVVLYIIGGGFVFRDNAHNDLISRIARDSKTSVFSVKYSLAPEYPYPTALNEIINAYKWLLDQHSPKDIAFVGDSAGGALVLSAIHKLKNEGLPIPACVVAISPATDATMNSASIERNKDKDVLMSKEVIKYFIDAYFQDTPRDNPLAFPLHGSFKGFPPILIHVDKHEIMHDDASRLVEKAKKEGVQATLYESEGLWHVWHIFARYLPEARIAIENVGNFIQTNLE